MYFDDITKEIDKVKMQFDIFHLTHNVPERKFVEIHRFKKTRCSKVAVFLSKQISRSDFIIVMHHFLQANIVQIHSKLHV